jgi:hypothetical protein
MANQRREIPNYAMNRLVAGVDWGGGGESATVLVIGFVNRRNKHFQVCRFDRWSPRADPEETSQQIATICNQLGVMCIAADGGGNGSVYNRLLLARMRRVIPIFAILYSSSDHEPVQNGVVRQWTVDRTRSISTLIARIKDRQVRFPCVADCGSFLDEMASVVTEYDNYTRRFRYVRTPGQPDDALHACNYAHLVGLRSIRAVY